MYKLSNRLSRIQNASKKRILTVDFKFQINQPILVPGIASQSITPTSETFFFLKILNLLQQEGFIRFFTYKQEKRCVYVTVYLKYNSKGTPAIRQICSISTAGRLVYAGSRSLWQPLTTQGAIVRSTPHGLRIDRQARRDSIGGQLLFSICLLSILYYTEFYSVAYCKVLLNRRTYIKQSFIFVLQSTAIKYYFIAYQRILLNRQASLAEGY